MCIFITSCSVPIMLILKSTEMEQPAIAILTSEHLSTATKACQTSANPVV